MLEIVSNKGALELSPNESIDWEEVFHLISDNADLKSWRFNLPKTAHNTLIISSFIDLDARRLEEVSIAVEVILFGQEWSRGPLLFIDESDTSWEVSFAGKMGYLLEKISNLKLHDFSYPIPNPVDIYTHAVSANNDANSDYIFAPVDLPGLQGDVWWPAQINSVVVDSNGDFDRFVEFWRHFEADDWSRDTEYVTFDVVRFNKNYYQALSGTATGESPTTHPAKWDQLFLGPILKYNAMVPFIKVFKILNTIATAQGFSLSGSLIENEELQELVFFNTVPLNSLVNNELGTVITNTQIIYQRHIPNIEVTTLLREIALLFNQRIDYSDVDNTLRFVPRSDSLNSPINNNLRNKVVKIETIHREKRTYNLGYSFNQSDVELATSTWDGSLEGIEAEKGSSDISSSFSTLPMRYGFNEVDPNWKEYPTDSPMDQSYPALWWRPVSSMAINADVPLQFLLWRGNHVYTTGPWVNDPELPQVSSDLNFNSLGSYSQTLLWRGTGGLYETYYKEYLYTLSLAKVLRLYFILDGQSWNRNELLQRQSFRDWVCLLELVKITLKRDSQRVIAEAQVIKL
tara:strand:+ start:663 stop:2381 length:1719 start_codon:yes stop_codon:yes gene_type:complete